MTKILTMNELRKMQEKDLLREIAEQRSRVARLRHTVRSGTEKGSHHLKSAKKQLSRMLTVLSSLRRTPSVSTIPVPTP